MYNKRCCKCESKHKHQEEFIGEYDLVLCDSCYIGILIETYIKTQCLKH